MLKRLSMFSSKWVLGFILVIALSFMLSFNVAKATGPYDVGIFYFDNWNPDLNPIAAGPTGDAWAYVKDYLTEPEAYGNGPIPYREPIAGWYDDRQQSVVDQQILQAASRGIDHFAFYYYWSESGGGEHAGQQAIYNFRNSAYKDLMKFYIYFIGDGQWPASDWDSLIVPKLVDFMKDPSYKKTPDGRPVVGFYGDFVTRLGGPAQLQAALQSLRTAAQNEGLQKH